MWFAKRPAAGWMCSAVAQVGEHHFAKCRVGQGGHQVLGAGLRAGELAVGFQGVKAFAQRKLRQAGGAGISCATSELASNGEGGMHVHLDRVLLRDPSLSPEEILMSESQERMCAIVTPDNVDAFLDICRKWEVEAVVIGEVTDSGRLTIDWHGERVVDS